MRRLLSRLPRAFDLTPLGHPVWWGALALLLINDNLFKGKGVVPNWLAGKLSDFTFLIVAPALFAALIPRRVPGRRTFAVVSVVALYVAADLSRAVSDAVVAAFARIGLHWQLWPDVTDLLALAVLPITVWLLRRPPRPAADATTRRSRVGRERAGVILGALACLATGDLGSYHLHPFLFNRTAAVHDVRITWVLARVDCKASPDSLAATLGPSDLDDPHTVTLARSDVATLDGIPAAGMSPVGLCSTHTYQKRYVNGVQGYDCTAAILETEGAAPTLMVTPVQWDEGVRGDFIDCHCGEEPQPKSQCAPHLDPNRSPGPEAVSLSDRDGTLRFELSRSGPREDGSVLETPIKLGPVDPAAILARPPVANGCRETRDSYHALLGDAATTCATDADCQLLPGLELPGEAPTCAVFVNRSVSAASLQAVEAHWQSQCAPEKGDYNSSQTCYALPATCRAGRCAELCAGVSVPFCPTDCRNYSDYPNGSCASGTSCLNAAKEICSCENQKYVCAAPTPVDPSCPFGCLSGDIYTKPAFDGGIDAGAATDGATGDAGDAG